MVSLLGLAKKLIPLVREAGEIELKYLKSGTDIMDKSDGSPVTLADQEAEDLIAKNLSEICPNIPMVGEESVAAGNIPDISGGEFWLVDPLDGTRDFIEGGSDFTVNIALLQNFIPVMGIIYVPVADELYFGAEGKAFMQLPNKEIEEIKTRALPDDGLTVITSKRLKKPERIKDFFKDQKLDKIIHRSSSLKFCAIAAGQADFYPRLGPTSEWDTAAGEAILKAAGGKVTNLNGEPLKYGKTEEKFLNPHFLAYT